MRDDSAVAATMAVDLNSTVNARLMGRQAQQLWREL
jgi:hypothetical protein